MYVDQASPYPEPGILVGGGNYHLYKPYLYTKCLVCYKYIKKGPLFYYFFKYHLLFRILSLLTLNRFSLNLYISPREISFY